MVRLALTQDIGAKDSLVIQLPKTSNKIGRKGDAAENPRSKRKMSVLTVVYKQNAVSVRIDGGSSRKYFLPFSWISAFDSYLQELLYALIDHFFGSSVRWRTWPVVEQLKRDRTAHPSARMPPMDRTSIRSIRIWRWRVLAGFDTTGWVPGQRVQQSAATAPAPVTPVKRLTSRNAPHKPSRR
jgi:hypothetical protein